MDQIFLSEGSTLAARWQEAFPDARLVAPRAAAGIAGAADGLLWLDGGRIGDREGLERAARQALEASPRVIVMRPAPSESEAFALLSLGVSGYCHLAASPVQLREIAERLAMSERTVKSHLSSIFRKMDVRDRVQLALAMNDIPVDSGA
jgi:DNA-binding NarL/FixJ family response regulator